MINKYNVERTIKLEDYKIVKMIIFVWKMEEYADIILTRDSLPKYAYDKNYTWEYFIRKKIYIHPEVRDITGRNFYDVWDQYLCSWLVSHDNTPPEKIIHLFNKTKIYSIETLYSICLSGFKNFEALELKTMLRETTDHKIRLLKFVLLDISSEPDFIRLFITKFLKLKMNSIAVQCKLITMLKEAAKIDLIPILIPKTHQLSLDVLLILYRNLPSSFVWEHYKGSILSNQRYILEYCITYKEIRNEFRRVPKILLLIAIDAPDEQLKEAFEEYMKRPETHPAITYTTLHKRAPPECLCVGIDKKTIITKLRSYRVNIPDYLFDFYTIGCEHVSDSEEAYACDSTKEILCPACSGLPPKKVFNVKCPICFEIPKQVFLFKCGHTICKDCFQHTAKCPFCERTEREYAFEEDDLYL